MGQGSRGTRHERGSAARRTLALARRLRARSSKDRRWVVNGRRAPRLRGAAGVAVVVVVAARRGQGRPCGVSRASTCGAQQVE